jgi:monofunctional biosynthetic peptidoglycan transglycosylase
MNGRRIVRWLLQTLLAAVAASGLAVLLMRFVPPLTSAFMIENRLASLAAGDFGRANDYDWVPLEEISPHAAIAVIASEDQLFPFHAGFDFDSIRQAIRYNAKGRKTRGASTISQQVAKNLFLWSGRSYLRKGLEVWFTVLVEGLWPKERILEVYLNVAEFGPDTYGVEAASRKFFGKSAARLTRREAATLAAVLPSPARMRAATPSAYVQRRSEFIMGQMRALGGESYLKQLDDEEPKRKP